MRNLSEGRLRYAALLAASTAIAQTAPAYAQQTPGANDPSELDLGEQPVPGASANASGPPTGDRIIVTGSRIARPDYTATSPIVTVDSELIERSSNINLEANLNKLPQFSPALTQFNTGDFQANANNTIGVSTVSLRQLGSNRNLVLLDGRRGTPVNGAGVVDINSIPSAAVQRVEIISGGASSTYGADAVGGVVNFILKDNFSGFDVDAQYGLSERGDGEEYRISTLVGADLEDGRGNVMLGMEHYKREAILRIDRPWYRDLFMNPDVTGTEQFLNENAIAFHVPAGVNPDNYRPSQAAWNALFASKGLPAGVNIPRASTVYLNDDGSVFLNTSTRVPLTTGAYTPLFLGYKGEVDGLEQKVTSAGLLTQNNTEELLSTPQQRWSFFGKGEYDITPDVRFVSQVNFARTRTRTLGLNTVALGSFGTLIPYNDNIYTGNAQFGIASSVLANGSTHPDYLPGGRYGLNCGPVGGCTNKQAFPVTPEVAALLDSRPNPNGDWRADIVPVSIARRYTDNNVTTYQILAGLEGTIEGLDWTWDVTGSYGETVAKTDTYGFFSADSFRTIVQAPNYGRNFRAQGNPGLPGNNRNGATASCTTGISPFNTAQEYSEDCGLATRIDAQVENRLKQKLAEANLQGGLFDLPYGELRFAAGAAIRTNSLRFHADSSSVEGATFYETVNGIFPQASTEGSITVKEAYGELLIPLLSGLPFAEEVNLEVGYRISDYSTIGSNSTYKINGEWAPIEWLRFRGGYQRAARAPNLGEVFTARTQTLAASSDGDPCSRGNTNSPFGYGNYSANPAENSNAAAVESLCRAVMGSAGAAEYYREGRTFPTGQGTFVPSLSAGAQGLKEETAKTYTIGAVVNSPTDTPWLSRLRLSADYYNVTLSDGISLQGVDSVYRQCFSPIFNPDFQPIAACERIQRDATTGEVQLITVNYSNLGRVETSGFDVQVDWSLRFEDVNVPIPGSISVNSNFTYLLRFATTADQFVIPIIDYAGTTGGGEVGTNAGSYRWKLFTRLDYNVGPFGVGLQWQHRPAIDHVTAVTQENSTIAGAPAYNLFNLNGRYAVTDNVNLRFGIDNLFDKAPPLIAYDTGADPSDGVLPGGRFDAGNYDVLGRRYFAAVNVSF
jgi:outer membrane receptor protein involved in Fe transport